MYFKTLVVGLSLLAFTTTAQTNFTELPDPTEDVKSDWSHVAPGLNVSFATIDKRFAKSVAPKISIQKNHKISGWKNERVSAQVLIWVNTDAQYVTVKFGDFISKSGKLPNSIASAHFVRYVMTDEFRNGCGHRKPEDFAASLSPDMLDNLRFLHLKAKTTRPVWITVDIPKDAKAGIYKSKITVAAEKFGPAQSLNLELEVFNHTLTPPTEWSYHLDYWQHPSAVARVDSVKLWSDEHFKGLEKTMRPLANAGQKVITATLNKDPWNVQTFDPYADMIKWTRKADGSWSYDYTVFDKWVTFMMNLGVKDMINCYSIIPWNSEIHYRDEVLDSLVNVKAVAGSKIFDNLWTPFLVDFTKHLKEKGWLKITNIAIDERSKEEVDAAIKLISKVSPELGLSYADNQKTYQRYPNTRDISIAVGHPFSHSDVIDRRERGLITTSYICCSDEFPNQFTFSDPAESTYLAYYALANDFSGTLRWAYNSWVEKPFHDSRFRTWPAGDTYLVYPQGRSSIRFERMLEGIQDYEKIQILRKKLPASKLEKFDLLVKKLGNNQRIQEWNDNLNATKKALEELSR